MSQAAMGSAPWRRIDVFVTDRNNKQLSGADLEYSVDGELAGEVSDVQGHASLEVENPDVVVEIAAAYDDEPRQTSKLAPGQNTWTFLFNREIGRNVQIAVVDRDGAPIPGADVTIARDGKDRYLVTNQAGIAPTTIEDPRVDAIVTARLGKAEKKEILKKTDNQLTVALPIKYVASTSGQRRFALLVFVTMLVFASVFGYFGGMETHLALIVGLLLAACATVLAFVFGNATPLQRQIILALFALAGGAIATEIPGFLNVQLTLAEKTSVAAGGAIAVFVILYFWPAAKPRD